MVLGLNLYKLLCLFICFCFTHLKTPENQDQFNLLIINDSNTRNYISMYKDFFIFIHSPWCKWSQRFNTNLIKVNELLKYESQANYLSLLDVTMTNIDILKDYLPSNIDVHTITYPKLIYLQNGFVNDIYRGMFDVDNSYLWIKRKILKNSLKVSLMQVFQTKVKFDKTSFMFFGDYSPSNLNFQVFNKLSNEILSSTFYHTDENILFSYLNPNRNFTVGFFRHGVLNDTLSGNITFDSLKHFINSKTIKNFYDKVDEEVIQDIFIKRNPAIVFFCSRYDEEYIFYYRTFKRIASEMRTKELNLKFLFTDIDRKMSLKVANFFGFRNDEYLPAVRIVEYEENDFKRYSLSRNITKNSIINFIQKWKDRELRSYTSYETFESDLSRQSKDSLIKKINYNSMFESVNYNRKSVIILFYTDWCSACKKVFFLFETLSKRFNKELISYFMVNLQNNESNNLGIKTVPTIYLYPFNNKENPYIYEGLYNIKALTEFVSSKLKIQVIKQDL